jgi:hypothetical protein
MKGLQIRNQSFRSEKRLRLPLSSTKAVKGSTQMMMMRRTSLMRKILGSFSSSRIGNLRSIP